MTTLCVKQFILLYWFTCLAVVTRALSTFFVSNKVVKLKFYHKICHTYIQKYQLEIE